MTAFWILMAAASIIICYAVGLTIAARDNNRITDRTPDCHPGRHTWRAHPSTRRFCAVCGYREKQVVRDEQVFDQQLADGTDFALWEVEL